MPSYQGLDPSAPSMHLRPFHLSRFSWPLVSCVARGLSRLAIVSLSSVSPVKEAAEVATRYGTKGRPHFISGWLIRSSDLSGLGGKTSNYDAYIIYNIYTTYMKEFTYILIERNGYFIHTLAAGLRSSSAPAASLSSLAHAFLFPAPLWVHLNKGADLISRKH